MSFSFKWPTFITNFLEGISFLGKGSYEAVISFDCLLTETRIPFFDNSDYIYKTFLSFTCLVCLFCLFLFLSFIWKFLCCRWVNLKWMLIVTIITVQFSQYTSISSMVLNLFNCMQIENENLLVRDLQTKCWTLKHMGWVFGFGVPLLILFLLVIPVCGTIFLILKRH